MGWLRRLFGATRQSGRAKKQVTRATQIETLGFRLIDQSGWLEGVFAERRYFLVKDEKTVAGPFASTTEAFEAAKTLAPPKDKKRG